MGGGGGAGGGGRGRDGRGRPYPLFFLWGQVYISKIATKIIEVVQKLYVTYIFSFNLN